MDTLGVNPRFQPKNAYLPSFWVFVLIITAIFDPGGFLKGLFAFVRGRGKDSIEEHSNYWFMRFCFVYIIIGSD
jgi:hypothetical protein